MRPAVGSSSSRSEASHDSARRRHGDHRPRLHGLADVLLPEGDRRRHRRRGLHLVDGGALVAAAFRVPRAGDLRGRLRDGRHRANALDVAAMITLLDVWLVALTLAVGDWFFGYGVLGIDRGATMKGI